MNFTFKRRLPRSLVFLLLPVLSACTEPPNETPSPVTPEVQEEDPGTVTAAVAEPADTEDSEQAMQAPIIDIHWTLTELNGRPVSVDSVARLPNMLLTAERKRAGGSAGCNDFFGGYETGNGKLRFTMLASTRKMCQKGMDTEQAYLDALGETDRYVAGDDTLELYAGQSLLARFSRGVEEP